MDHRRHGRQGWSLLILQAAIDLALVGLAAQLFGLSGIVLACGAAVMAAIGLGTWALWRAGRYGFAWALVFVPGLALATLAGMVVLILWAYL